MSAPVVGGERHVLHVSQAVLGVAYVIDDYVRSQLKAGWRVTVACPEGMLDDMARVAGAEVLTWPADRRPRPDLVAREMRSLSALIRAARPDLVHVHSAKGGLVGRLVVRGSVPTVYTPHAWSWLAVSGPQRRLALRWERFGTRWADAVCCVSEAERRLGEEAGLRAPWRVLPNDVDIAGLRAGAPADRATARTMLGVPADAKLAVCTARLAPQKGQDVLLEAWAQVHRSVPGAMLCLVGGGPDEELVRSLAAALPGVVLAGPQPRETSLAWTVAADVVVLPSRYEGMPLVPLEAAALGRAVVTTDVEGVREGDFVAGRVIVPVGDPASLGEALAGLLGDQARRVQIEQLVRHRADELLDEPRSPARLLQLYDELLST